MKDESQQQVPPGIVAFKNGKELHRKPKALPYSDWVQFYLPYKKYTIHTILVENKEYSVGDKTNRGKIQCFRYGINEWLADMVPGTSRYPWYKITELFKENEPFHPLLSKNDEDKLKALHTPPSSPDRSGSQPGEEKETQEQILNSCTRDTSRFLIDGEHARKTSECIAAMDKWANIKVEWWKNKTEAYRTAFLNEELIVETQGKKLEELEYQVAKFKKALLELVALKAIKDNFGKTEDYEERQPKAWEEARNVLLSTLLKYPNSQ